MNELEQAQFQHLLEENKRFQELFMNIERAILSFRQEQLQANINAFSMGQAININQQVTPAPAVPQTLSNCIDSVSASPELSTEQISEIVNKHLQEIKDITEPTSVKRKKTGGRKKGSKNKKTLRSVKELFDQKSAVKTNGSMAEYPNPGPVENNIFTAVHDGKGAITVSAVGGDFDPKQLTDLDW